MESHSYENDRGRGVSRPFPAPTPQKPRGMTPNPHLRSPANIATAADAAAALFRSQAPPSAGAISLPPNPTPRNSPPSFLAPSPTSAPPPASTSSWAISSGSSPTSASSAATPWPLPISASCCSTASPLLTGSTRLRSKPQQSSVTCLAPTTIPPRPTRPKSPRLPLPAPSNPGDRSAPVGCKIE